MRVTTNQPKNYDRCIYLYGPCVIMGTMVEDKHTIGSFLQNMINREDYRCKVVNCGAVGYIGPHLTALPELGKVMHTPLKAGDVIIVDYLEKTDLDGKFATINYVDVIRKNDIEAKWITWGTRHCNYKVNKLYASAIFDKIEPEIRKNVDNRANVHIPYEYIDELYIKRFFGNFNKLQYQKIGAIVMNCNPFTKGHRYLIEEARKQVDFLIVFVVEEDGSYFSFHERYSMVCEGVADMDGIMVVPSGGFILTKSTFPQYFVKEIDENIERNTENDIRLFAEEIASRLNITHRFVGEEREDIVTRTYNDTMNRVLPEYGIQFIEIPRKKCNEHAISASLVRKYLENGNWDKLVKLVPETTKLFLEYSLPD